LLRVVAVVEVDVVAHMKMTMTGMATVVEIHLVEDAVVLVTMIVEAVAVDIQAEVVNLRFFFYLICYEKSHILYTYRK